ncbi:MAG TPA: hypothetical protein VIF62_30055 [Labilithrix sp.]|jgi:hypothetical protein
MFTKTILVAGFALLGLTAACSADAGDDGARGDSEALATSQNDAYPCDPRDPACQCHTLESCNALEKLCLESGGKMQCGDPQTCFCTWAALTQPTSPTRVVRPTSGLLAR